MKAWEGLQKNDISFEDYFNMDTDEADKKQQANDQQKLLLILAKLESKSPHTVSSLEDLNFIKTLHIKKAELEKLLEQTGQAKSVLNLKSLEFQLFHYQAEAEQLLMEMKYLKHLQEEKLTPMAISLGHDRLEQQKAIMKAIRSLRSSILNSQLEKKAKDLEITLREQIKDIYKEDSSFIFWDSKSIEKYQASLPSTPFSNNINKFIQSEITLHLKKIPYDTPKSINECESDLHHLKEAKEKIIKNEKATIDIKSLELSQLEGRPNFYDHQEQYWPYGWKGRFLRTKHGGVFVWKQSSVFTREIKGT